jgi:ribonuclease HII
MNYIIGLDEVGYGAWAGPLVVGAVRAPTDWVMEGLKDSKKLSKDERTQLWWQLLDGAIKTETISFSLEYHNNDKIDSLGLATCHKQCYVGALKQVYKEGDEVIFDGNLNPKLFIKHGLDIDLSRVKSVIKADDKFPTVMAASVIAKYYRDMIMTACHDSYPQYGWGTNVGYIVPEHREAVKKHGLSVLHRKSYKVKY